VECLAERRSSEPSAERGTLKFWTKGLIIVTAVAGVSCLISWFGNSSKGDTQSPSTTSTIPAYQERQASPPHVYLEPEAGVQPAPKTFDGYECTVDCSGHQAGYYWAEEHGISDGDDCDAAGEHSNSPSFAEGCHAYVDGGDTLASDDSTDDVSGDDDGPSGEPD
jgi:hypothetical protein